MRRWLQNWAVPLSVALHASVVGAMVMQFEDTPKPPPAAPLALSLQEPVAETVTEAKLQQDPINAAPPPPPEMQALEMPPEPVKANPPPSPMVPVDTPPVIETQAADAMVVAAVPPKVVRAKPKPDVVAEKKPEVEAPPMAAPPPPSKPDETSTVVAAIKAPPEKVEMKASAAGQSGPPPDFRDQVRIRLEQARRGYPRSAELRRQEGTPHLRFTMDRAGKVVSWKIERSSGFPGLDSEAEAMLQRAQLPPFPDEMPGAQLELIVPIQFHINRGR